MSFILTLDSFKCVLFSDRSRQESQHSLYLDV